MTLVEFRKSRALTQGDIAKAAGVSVATVHRVENGSIKISASALRAISAATGGVVRMADLVEAMEITSDGAAA